jgi:hypothetical protein
MSQRLNDILARLDKILSTHSRADGEPLPLVLEALQEIAKKLPDKPDGPFTTSNSTLSGPDKLG